MPEQYSDKIALKLLKAFAASLFFVLALYPDLVLLETTPLYGESWELSDPFVSFMNFEPSFKVVQYELFHNSNLLWSNLRSMGLPLLVNDIHAAPLFPLTLLLCWLPAQYFWNVFVVARLLLMGIGAYLLARDFLRFRDMAAVFFTFSFVFTMFVLRWMNHSWQSGLLAGIWYLYFLYLVAGSSRRPYRLKRFFVVLGLTLCVYAMVTCGFPESAAMSAILVVLVYTPFVIHLLLSGRLALRPFLFDLLASHLIGFALSSAQIFSILEMLPLFEGAENRATYGLRQFPLADFLPFWAENIGMITGARPALLQDSRTYFGLIPLFFFFLGLVRTGTGPGRNWYRVTGALLCCLFVLFKFFPLWPSFNLVVGSLPVLKESYFFVYFLQIFLWFFAYYVARGVQAVFYDYPSTPGRFRYSRLLLSVIAAGTVAALLWWSVTVVFGTSPLELLVHAQGNGPAVVLASFIGAFLLVLVLLKWGSRRSVMLGSGGLLIGLAVLELSVVLPRDFSRLGADSTRLSAELADNVERHGVFPAEVRMKDPNGFYVSGGIATADIGAPAILPHRLFVFRRTLFDVSGGYFPVRSHFFDYSWPLTSTSLIPTEYYWGGMSPPAWQEKQAVAGGQIHLDVFNVGTVDLLQAREADLSGSQVLHLSGWAADTISRPPDDRTRVFVVFRSGDREITIPTTKVYRTDLKSSIPVNSGWQVLVEAGFFEPGAYEVLIRVLRGDEDSYFELASGCVTRFSRNEKDVEGFLAGKGEYGKGGEYIGSTSSGFVYYDRAALPRAYIASGCAPVDTLSAAVQHLQDKENFRLGQVFVEDLSQAEADICAGFRQKSPARVPIISDRGKEVVLGPVEGPAVVVLNDTYYPGWKALDEVSGRLIEIKPANIAVRSLILPEARTYRVVFKYVPSWLAAARALMWSALLALVLMFCLGLRGTLAGFRDTP